MANRLSALMDKPTEASENNSMAAFRTNGIFKVNISKLEVVVVDNHKLVRP